ncbi:MAG: hypothetical protein M1833_002971 [Piccolia ochrophora]|nr:MAG: hypothetical protein M1833_002971 [Piccolia ochrophora]
MWRLWLVAMLAVGGIADTLDENLSFGHKEGQSLSANIRGWRVQGDPQTPSILSDKIILTPPYPGHQRGAIWAENQTPTNEWTADFDFRATGPERGGGNLQMWYTREHQGASSAYTIGKFDGLVLVIDTYGGSGGVIRGFLNDGSVEYKNHHNVDSLAFGHCSYAYRNLGRPSKVQIKQTSSAFELNVDGRPCFKSEQIKLPHSYYFGISAASAENPDSFEVYKFSVATAQAAQASTPPQNPPTPPPPPTQPPNDQLKKIESHLDTLSSRLTDLSSTLDTVQKDLNSRLPQKQPQQQQSELSSLSSRLQSVESIVRAIQKDVEGRDYKEHLTQLQQALSNSHASLLERIPASVTQAVTSKAPRLSFLVGAVVVVQLAVVVSYVIYKRRRGAGGKKYL